MISREIILKNFLTSENIHKYFIANKRLIRKNEVIFNQNDKASKLYYIISGKVLISKIFHKEKIHKLATTNDIIGFESYAGNLKYSASATVLEDTVVSIVSSEEINTIIKQHSYIFCKLMIKIFKYLMTVENRTSVIAFKTIAENLNDVLSEINEENNINRDVIIADKKIKKRDKTQLQKPAAHPAKPNYFQRKIKQIICL